MLKTLGAFAAITTFALSATASFAEDMHEHIMNFDDVEWTQEMEGAESAVIWGEEGEDNAIWAFRLQPGTAFPPHTHSDDYIGFSIQGNWVHIDEEGNEVTTSPGSFAIVKGGDVHADRCEGPEVCINLIQFDGVRDISFSE